MLVVNFNMILMGDYWGDPEAFRPERFIDNDGKLFMPEQFLPFSFGDRKLFCFNQNKLFKFF